MPDIEAEIVESGEGKGPLNVRGTGEPPVGPVAPAIASAIADATGCRPTRLPMTAERVLPLLDAARPDKPSPSRRGERGGGAAPGGGPQTQPACTPALP